jgi:potassium efflux system protein
LKHYLRLAVTVAAAVTALHVLTRLLPLPPLLMDLLDRLGMLAFLALLPSALGIQRALRERVRAVPATRSRGLGFVCALSRLLPGFVLVTGLAGVLGYTNLAWTLIGFSLWLTLVTLGLYLAAGLLQALSTRIDARLQSTNTENADFWQTHFVEPGRRLGQLGLYLGAGWLLLWLWGWDAQTPPVRWVLTLARTELFQLGTTPFTAGDILLTLLLVGAALWVGGWSQQVSYRLAYRRVRDLGLRQALATFTRYVVIVAGVLLALSVIGFDLTALTVFAASLGVGIGFGLQNIVNNFISGILLLAERPLRIGDFVSIGANDGTVTQIGIRSLTVRTPDRQEVVIPNGSVISSEFTNWTREDDTVRQVHYLLIRYDSDREQAMTLVRQVLDDDPHVLKDPAPGVYLWEYTDRGVRLRVQFCFRFVHGPGSFATRSGVLAEIGRRFAEAGIEFADVGLLQRLAADAA